MRTIGVVTVGRSDYGIYLPVLQAIQSAPDLQLMLIVSGAHLSPEFGMTVRQIEESGIPIAERVEMLLSSDSPMSISMSMGLGMIGFAQLYQRSLPDLLLVLGDRFEMYAAALAAVPFNIPIAHIHGGEVTQGAIDEVFRHSLTKMSHLHFVSTSQYAQRVAQLGEEPWRITVSGAPALDHLQTLRRLTPEAFQARYGITLPPTFLLATYHPVTREYEQAGSQFAELLAALGEIGLPTLFTLANADTNGRVINTMIRSAVEAHPWASMVDNLGSEGYFNALGRATAMIGNSSSGIIEAASFELPVVNIGARQSGRVRGKNVIDVSNDRAAIVAGIRRTLDPAFRQSLHGMQNPYGDGQAAERIVGVLREVPLDTRLTTKPFYDLAIAATATEQ